MGVRDRGLHAPAGPDEVPRLPVGIWAGRRPARVGGRHAAATQPNDENGGCDLGCPPWPAGWHIAERKGA